MSVGNRLRGFAGLGLEGRERMVGAALDLLDEGGLEGLTMRNLAERLGMRAASLYWHIRDKQQLLGLVAEAIVAEVPEPASDQPWRAQLEAFAAAYRRVLHSHRDAARIVIEVQPAAPHLYERLVRPLLAAGFDGEVAVDASHLIAGTYVPAAVAGEWGAVAPPDRGQGELRAPLGTMDRARLEVAGGAAAMTLRGDPALADLYAGRFQGKPPTVRVQDGTLRIEVRHKRLQLRPDPADLALSTAIPWDIDIGGGAWRLRADLRRLRVEALAVSGGVSEATLWLPSPAGTVPVRVSGGAHNLTIHRPAGVAARIRVGAGAGNLTLDTLHLAAAGETRWETPDFAASADRYDVEIDSGAVGLTLDTGGEDDAEEQQEQPAAGKEPAGWPDPLSPDEYPALAPLAGHLLDPDLDARFEFGLRVLLDGLERRLP